MESKSSSQTIVDIPRPPIGRDLQGVQANGVASVAELREFFEKLRGRNPQEVVGLVSSSLLLQSVALATLLTVAIVALFTIGPYLISGPPQEKVAKKPAAAEQTPAEPAAAPAATATGAKPGAPDAAKAMQAMGEDDTKVADPTANPLDKKLDKLLDGIE